MKECIACAEEIKENAKLCRHCGTEQNDDRFLHSQIRGLEAQVGVENSGSDLVDENRSRIEVEQSNIPRNRPKLAIPLAVIAVLSLFAVAMSLSGVFGNDLSSDEASTEEEFPNSDLELSSTSDLLPRTLWEALGIDEDVFIENSEWIPCSELGTILGEYPFDEEALSRIDVLKAPLEEETFDETIKASQELVKSQPWVSIVANLPGTNPNVLEFSTPVLHSLLNDAGLVNAEDLQVSNPTLLRRWSVDFARALANGCGLSKEISLQERQIGLAAAVVSRAFDTPFGTSAFAGWWPESFTGYFLDLDLAFKWADRSCSGNGACWHLDVVSRYSCDSLYAEISISDSSGNLVDWSNDSARGLMAGQVAELEFRSFEKGTLSGRIIELTCRS